MVYLTPQHTARITNYEKTVSQAHDSSLFCFGDPAGWMRESWSKIPEHQQG